MSPFHARFGRGWKCGPGHALALAPEPAVETLDEAVLHEFAGGVIVLFYAPLLAPVQDGHADQLRSIVGGHREPLTAGRENAGAKIPH